MTRDETRECLVLVTGTFPHLKLTKATMDAWHTLLADLPGPVAQQATVNVLRQQTGSWWPTPGAIRQEAIALQDGEWPTADQAWGQVTQAVRWWGYMQPEAAYGMMDAPVAQVVRALGWRDICEADPGIIRGQFLKFYQDARDHGQRKHHTEAVPALASGTDGVASLAEWAQGFGRHRG